MIGLLLVSCSAALFSGNWLAGLLAGTAVSLALWQFLLPVTYEIYGLGIRRHVLGRTRTVPWHAVRAFRRLAEGVVLYQRPDPTAIDSLRSLFLPYPPDEDEMRCALREHLGHAVELS
jgi:hypothetical protein